MAYRGDRAARPAAAACLLALLAAGGARAADGAGVLRDGFESETPAWRQEKTDSQVRLFAHDRSARSTRDGQRSEHFQFEAGPGAGFYFSYGLPKVPITPNLTASIQVRSDRSGVQILGKVILPGDVDPETNQPSFVLIPGTILDASDRWQRLELIDLPLAVERQARVLRAATKRKVDLDGAYLDRLIVNLYGGPGSTEVFLDDLRVGPVAVGLVADFERSIRGRDEGVLPPLPSSRPDVAGGADADPKGPGRAIRLDGGTLTRRGYPWFPTIVRAPGVDPSRLRRAGFDVLALPVDADPEAVKEAVAKDLLLQPEVDADPPGSGPDPDRAGRLLEAFPARDAVAFVSLGRALGLGIDLEARRRERDRVRDVAQALRKGKGPPDLSTGEVGGHFASYARAPDQLDLLGVRPLGWGTTQEPQDFFRYLEQRRNLVALENADALVYSWIPMAPDPAFRSAIWGLDRPPSWGVPRVQPDQLRLFAYLAISAGCRGLGFDADLDVTQGAGRSLLIEAAFLNEEIDLFEWLLADTGKSITAVKTYPPTPPEPPPIQGVTNVRSSVKKRPEQPANPTIRAMAFGTKDRRGTLLVVADYAKHAQYQPPQMAMKDLKIIVRGLDDAQAYEVSPGNVATLDRVRVPGGLQITVPEFGGTSLIYLTTDGARVVEIQRAVAAVRPSAVGLAIEQAQIQLAWVAEIHRLLVEDGHPMAEGDELLLTAQRQIKSAQDAQERQDYEVAWEEARRSIRPLQILMRYQWDQAIAAIKKTLNDPTLACGPAVREGETKPIPRVIDPVAVPPAVTFGTLPQAWIWEDRIRRGRLSKNLLPSGDFERAGVLKGAGWTDESYEIEGVSAGIVINPGGSTSGKSALRLSGPPVDKATADKMPPFRDQPVAAVRTPPIKVYAEEVVRISVMVMMTYGTVNGAGGLIVRDSLGGEPLEFRSSLAIPGWHEVVLYRRVPADGEMTVLLGYAGVQGCQFDDLKVQKIVAYDEPAGPAVAAGRGGPARPSPR